MPMLAFLVLATTVPSDVRQDLSRLHDRLARLYVTKRYDDMVTLTTTHFAPEFVDLRSDGRKYDLFMYSNQRDDELRNLRGGKSDGPLRWRTHLDGWRWEGDRLILLAHHDVVGEWLKDGRRLPVAFKSAVRETWVRRDGEWKALRFQELSIGGRFNGKPFSSKGS